MVLLRATMPWALLPVVVMSLKLSIRTTPPETSGWPGIGMFSNGSLVGEGGVPWLPATMPEAISSSVVMMTLVPFSPEQIVTSLPELLTKSIPFTPVPEGWIILGSSELTSNVVTDSSSTFIPKD